MKEEEGSGVTRHAKMLREIGLSCPCQLHSPEKKVKEGQTLVQSREQQPHLVQEDTVQPIIGELGLRH